VNSTLEILKQVESLGPYRLVLPFALFFISIVASKLFKVPWGIVLIFGALPLAAPFINLPFASQLQHEHPLLFIAGGWLILLALVIGRFLAKMLLGTLSPTHPLGGLYSIGTAACVLVVTILMVNPALLERYFPGWKGTMGLALVSFALLAFTLSCFRFLRAGGVIVFWAGLCAVLGGEVFLNKLPQEILGQNFEQLSPLFKSLKIVSGTKAQTNKVLVATLGGSQMVGSDSYPRRLEQLLNRSTTGQKVDVQSFSSSRATVASMQRMLVNSVLPKAPDIVIISGWFDDYLEAKDRGELTKSTAKPDSTDNSPLLSAISNLSLVKAAKNALGVDDSTNHQPGVERYRQGLTEMAQQIKKAGAIPILFTEPIASRGHRTEQAVYDRVTESVATAQDAGFVKIDSDSPNYDLLFEGENVLSSSGEQVASRKLLDAVIAARAAKGSDSILSRALESIRTAATSIIVPTKELKNLVTVSFDHEQSKGPYRAQFAINDTIVHEQQFGLDDSARASFRIPPEFAKYPAVKLSIKAMTEDAVSRDLDAGIILRKSP
jgi:hypothetical protein